MRYTPNRQPTWVTPAWALEPPLNGEPPVPDMASGGVATKAEPPLVGERANPFPSVFSPKPRMGKWMSTFTGRQFWPLDPRAEEVSIEDIAHSLAMTCRYGGHCLRFYSVAEHSVLIARWLQEHYGDLPAVVLKGLLHDSPEAYLTDVPRPIKGSLLGYKEMEARLWSVIANMHGTSDAMPDEVHEADNRILADEMAQNMTLRDPDYTDPLGVTLQFWTPEQAKAEFLAAYWAIIESGRL